MSPRAIVLLLLAILVARPVFPDEGTKEADAALRTRVARAIERGAAWLAGQQQWDGSFGGACAASYPVGASALPLLALLHSGVPRDGDTVRRALVWLRAQRASRGVEIPTYSAAVLVMALVEASRGPDGRLAPSERDREWLGALVGRLISTRDAGGAWRYPGGGYDQSNTQYALLALKAARAAGIEVDDEVFAKALRHLLSQQERDGPEEPRYREHGGDGIYSATREKVKGRDRARGWGYVSPVRVTASMTAAGVAGVAICRSELRGQEWRRLADPAETSLRDGLAWLGRNFSVGENLPVGALWHFYYLYGLERAGVLAGVVWTGKHRWYAEGARYLVDAQGPDGAWRSEAQGAGVGPATSDPVEQSFALLFLARATARSPGVATERPLADLTSAGELPEAAFADLFANAFDEMDDLPPERAAGRARDFALLGPRVIPLVLPLLSAEEEGRRARADLILRTITGKSFAFEAGSPPADREAAVDRWTEWYLARRGLLALDRGAMLIR